MSFNIPAHVLAMPNNIVKYCDVDFSVYANAIGAFYKIDPNLEHINLLESMAVVSKQAGNALPLQVLTVAGISAGLVFAVFFGSDQVNRNINRNIQTLETAIENGQFDEKEAEMQRMEEVKTNFANYKYSVRLAQVMFDFLPRGDLPQIMEQLEEGLSLVESDDNMEGTFYGFHNMTWNGYDINLTVYGGGDEVRFPSDYVDALNQIGFFDFVSYGGFKAVPVETLPPDVQEFIPSGESHPIQFNLSLKLKGGHVFERDGSVYNW
jgi:type IV pilus assembly protein PilM